MKKKLNVCLLISFIIGVLYLIYSFVYWGGATGSASSTASEAGAAIATVMVTPHLVCVAVAVVFNALGLFMKKAGFALVGAIMYTVALVLFIPYFMFVVVEMVLSYIGYAQLHKQAAAK
ncbi:MAG: hypothetical protein PUD09_05890 [Coriobacteriales bacterium]|nr:hypothetical protein [Coriobacteriales bacterium]